MIDQIETINRLLASIEALQVDVWASEQDVAEYYKTQYVYPVRDSFGAAREFGIEAGLNESRKNKLRLTRLGQKYLQLGLGKGEKFILEPNAKQKLFLNKNIFLRGALSGRIKDLLSNFHRDKDENLMILKKDIHVISDRDFMNLLLQSGFLMEHKHSIVVSPEHAETFRRIFQGLHRKVDPETFYVIQRELEVLAQVAEKHIFDYERRRLKRTGAHKQSKSIVHTSEKNVAAGYDITSFDSQDSKQPDRFIEVKAGRIGKIRFFLTKREFEVAQKLRDSYWIYYVTVKENKPLGIRQFKDPAKSIMNSPNFEKRVDTYEIFEV